MLRCFSDRNLFAAKRIHGYMICHSVPIHGPLQDSHGFTLVRMDAITAGKKMSDKAPPTLSMSPGGSTCSWVLHGFPHDMRPNPCQTHMGFFENKLSLKPVGSCWL